MNQPMLTIKITKIYNLITFRISIKAYPKLLNNEDKVDK